MGPEPHPTTKPRLFLRVQLVFNISKQIAILIDEIVVAGISDFTLGVLNEIPVFVCVIDKIVDCDAETECQRDEPGWVAAAEVGELEQKCKGEVHYGNLMEVGQGSLEMATILGYPFEFLAEEDANSDSSIS